MNSDVLKEACKRLLNHHRESEAVCRDLEYIDKSSGPQHRPKHAYNRDFYERMGQTDKTERVLHFPKIIKDALLLKRKKKLLEKRRHVLRVYKILEDAGANFE